MAGLSTRQKWSQALFNVARPLIVAGSFETDAGNEPTNVRGEGFTVTYQATGEYIITFPDPYPMLISCVANLQDTSETDSYVEVDSYDSATGILILRVMDAATNGPVAEDGPRVNFMAVFQPRNQLARTHTA